MSTDRYKDTIIMKANSNIYPVSEVEAKLLSFSTMMMSAQIKFCKMQLKLSTDGFGLMLSASCLDGVLMHSVLVVTFNLNEIVTKCRFGLLDL